MIECNESNTNSVWHGKAFKRDLVDCHENDEKRRKNETILCVLQCHCSYSESLWCITYQKMVCILDLNHFRWRGRRHFCSGSRLSWTINQNLLFLFRLLVLINFSALMPKQKKNKKFESGARQNIWSMIDEWPAENPFDGIPVEKNFLKS